MKRSKILLALAMSVMLLNSMTGKPKEELPKNLAKNMLQKVCKYVDLTNEQREAILNYATVYEQLMKVTIQDKDVKSNQSVLDAALLTYREKIDSILTQEQKDTMVVAQVRELREQTMKLKNK